METTRSLTSQLLIAMPGMQDPNFATTVTLICEHNDEGALGIIINRPLDLRSWAACSSSSSWAPTDAGAHQHAPVRGRRPRRPGTRLRPAQRQPRTTRIP
jgi:putative AlgH/UPF0301 family transcriptional regulator